MYDINISRNAVLLAVLVLTLSIVGIAIWPYCMGDGDAGRLKMMCGDLITLPRGDLVKKYGDSINEYSINGETIIGICDDSHSSPFGGNMAIRFPNGEILTKMGHVCGSQMICNYMRSGVQVIERGGRSAGVNDLMDRLLKEHGFNKTAQQVDSAAASTIAVPPSEPSGSPR